MVIKALIADDEAPARDELRYLLTAHPDVRSQEADSAEAALEHIVQDQPDLVFLDIQMPGKDGFYVLEQSMLLQHPPLFVFVTAYDQYAIKAFEANALDYLLKPVSAKRLGLSLDRVRTHLSQEDSERDISTLERLLEGLQQRPQAAQASAALTRLPLEQGGRVKLVPLEEIVLIEADGKRITALTNHGQFCCHGCTTLDKMEKRLSGAPFFRANRGILLNLERIAEFSPWFSGKYYLEMDDSERTKITVSRNRVRDFKTLLGL